MNDLIMKNVLIWINLQIPVLFSDSLFSMKSLQWYNVTIFS
jgi:hypothetical protein